MKEILMSFINKYDYKISIDADKVDLFQYNNKNEIVFNLGNQDLTTLIANIRYQGGLDVVLEDSTICKEFAYSSYVLYILSDTSLGKHELPDYGMNELFTVETKVNLITTNYKTGYHNYLQTSEWYDKRNQVLRFSNHKCNRCKETENLQVHHLNYNSIGDESLNDLEVVCRSCHKKIHKL
jgi:hypothetical protein